MAQVHFEVLFPFLSMSYLYIFLFFYFTFYPGYIFNHQTVFASLSLDKNCNSMAYNCLSVRPSIIHYSGNPGEVQLFQGPHCTAEGHFGINHV